MPKPVSIEKLQAFIEAVEFAADLENPEDWVPTPRQWKKIKSMIDSLEEPQRVASPVQYASAGIQGQDIQRNQPRIDAPPLQYAPSSFDNVATAPIQVPRDVPMSTSDGTMSPIPTPNIDTSNGGYTSTFL